MPRKPNPFLRCRKCKSERPRAEFPSIPGDTRGRRDPYCPACRSRIKPLPPLFVPNPVTGCWEWQRATSDGYGVLVVDGRMTKAHRYFYELMRGPIPEGLDIDHGCRNRRCVNPDHVEPVTVTVNNQRAAAALKREGRTLRCSRLTAEQVREIRRRRASGESVIQIARQFGVNRETVRKIVNGVTYSHIA